MKVRNVKKEQKNRKSNSFQDSLFIKMKDFHIFCGNLKMEESGWMGFSNIGIILNVNK